MSFLSMIALAAQLAGAGNVDSISLYNMCVSSAVKGFAGDSNVSKPADAAMAECEPFLTAAVAQMRINAGEKALAKVRSDYHAAHDSDPDTDVLLADMIRDAAHRFADQTVAAASASPASQSTATQRPSR